MYKRQHNEESNYKLAKLIDEKGLKRDDPRIFFAQLLGMSDNISFNLAHEGYNVTKYVPYAKVRDVLPYLIRRAEENTSVAGQTSRELRMLKAELDRRKAVRAFWSDLNFIRYYSFKRKVTDKSAFAVQICQHYNGF